MLFPLTTQTFVLNHCFFKNQLPWASSKTDDHFLIISSSFLSNSRSRLSASTPSSEIRKPSFHDGFYGAADQPSAYQGRTGTHAQRTSESFSSTSDSTCSAKKGFIQSTTTQQSSGSAMLVPFEVQKMK
jgi:hypothetical protein